MKNTNPHFFIGIKPEVQVINKLEQIRTQLQKKFPFKKWVHPSDYHITLAFLGSVSDEKREELQQLLKEAPLLSDEFKLQIEHIGVFGQSKSPRIFWAGVKEEKKLFDLRNQVYDLCKKVGFQLETRPYHPHLTLARKWSTETVFSEHMLTDYQIEKNLVFEVQGIHLFQTHLERTPKYEIIKSFYFNE